MVDDLVVQGIDVSDGPSAPDEFEWLYGSQASYRPLSHAITRGGGARAAVREVSVDGNDDDILEIETVAGVVDFMTVRVARERLREKGERRLESLYPAARGSSPISSVTRSAFEVADPDVSAALDTLHERLGERVTDALLDPVARVAMKKVAEWIDRPADDHAPAAVRRKKPKRRGLYRVDEQLRLEPDDRIEDLAPAHADPALLMLHGTFSHTEAAFGGILRTQEWQQLNARYGDRMYALEHATLSRTPVENALDLVEQLPEGTRLHVVSHSRGGLVGEAMSFAQALREESTLAFPLYPAPGDPRRGPDPEALARLHAQMRAKDLRIDRFVRVACPARGTTLASHRLDRYATYLFNALRLLPGLPGSGVVEAVKLVLLTFLDQRADVRAVPGLEAQMPESPFIGTLNTVRGAAADDNMVAITGDVEGSGLFDRLKVFGADLFFRDDHDFVVNTSAMDQGVRRIEPRVTSFKGPAYSHSNYFTDNDSRKALASWLLATDVDRAPAPVGSDGASPSASRGRSRPAIRATLPTVKGTVVLVPDLMGSRIGNGDTVQWPVPAELAGDGLEEFLDALDTSRATGLVAAYDPLVKRLEPSVPVKAFAYHWNEGLEDAAQRLNTLLASVDDGPVHVVAHGAGCRVLVAADASDGAPHRGSNSRRILLSPPLAASGLVRARQQGRDALTAALATLSGLDAAAIGGRLVGNGDGVLSSLAEPLTASSWKPYRAVFGRAAHTWVHDGDGALLLSSEGDGHTLSAVPDDLLSHQVEVPFDRLVSDEVALDLLLRLLDPAQEVAEQRPDPRADGGTLASPPDAVPVVFPTESDLVRAGMGAPDPPQRERAKLKVRVVHGNLTGASEMLVVGTQNGTPLAGAESALDRRLDEVLSRHRLLGEYPGPLGTCQLFASPVRPVADGGAAARTRADAAVIGIGDPGDLTTGDLTAGVAQAVLRLVAAQPRGVRRELDIATVLIGTVGPGSLAVSSAVNAAISGVRRANRRIKDLRLRQHVGSLTIYELYEDRAVEALHSAALLQPEGAIADDDELEIAQFLHEGVDGRPGTPRSDYYAERWRSIRVSGMPAEDDSPLRALSFTEAGRSAGAATRITLSQHKIIEKLVAQSIDSPTVDEQIYNTLYELLVPRSMKGQGRLGEDIMLMLDEHAAALPFEMLATRSYDDGVVPISVEVGMIRRLESTRLRELVRPSPGHQALVIGDPFTGKGQVRLPGAVREANAVADLLESRGWGVTRLISRDGKDERVDTQAVLNALFAHEYRIIHIAAHGQYDADNPGRSGVCIGPGDFLTAAEIEQMQTTPDLAFLNCCHVGSGVGRADKLASSISRKLIDSGIRAVVAAGWAVDDSAASTFATTFYDNLLDGRHLGKATLRARKRVHQEFGNTNTWGAYQVYGEPAFQLERLVSFREAGRLRSRRELHDQLASIRRRAMFADEKAEGELRRDLRDLVAFGASRGWVQGVEHEAIGEAWRALGDYEAAIACYEAALQTGFGAASFHVISQLSTAHGRRGAWEVRRDGDLETADGHFAEADRLLRSWRSLVTTPDGAGGTPELLMSEANLTQQGLWRFVAAGRDRAGLQKEIRSTARRFEAAADAFENDDALRDSQQAHYTRLAAIAFGWLAIVTKAASAAQQKREIASNRGGWRKQVRALMQVAEDAPWSTAPYERTRIAFLALVSNLVLNEPTVEDVAAHFTCAFDKGVSRRERESTLQWAELILACLPETGRTVEKPRDALARLLDLLDRCVSGNAVTR